MHNKAQTNGGWGRGTSVKSGPAEKKVTEEKERHYCTSSAGPRMGGTTSLDERTEPVQRTLLELQQLGVGGLLNSSSRLCSTNEPGQQGARRISHLE